MTENIELMILGLAKKYNYTNNINVSEIRHVVECIDELDPAIDKCALFYTKIGSGYHHVLFAINRADNQDFKVYAGVADKKYLSDYSQYVLELIDTTDMTVINALEDTFKKAYDRVIRPIYHIPSINPGKRLMDNVNGQVNKFLRIAGL